jgi:hypothetical protein
MAVGPPPFWSSLSLLAVGEAEAEAEAEAAQTKTNKHYTKPMCCVPSRSRSRGRVDSVNVACLAWKTPMMSNAACVAPLRHSDYCVTLQVDGERLALRCRSSRKKWTVHTVLTSPSTQCCTSYNHDSTGRSEKSGADTAARLTISPSGSAHCLFLRHVALALA